MFEQSVLNNERRGRRVWVTLVSTAVQLFFVAIALLLPLAFTEALPVVMFPRGLPLPPAGRPPKPVELVATPPRVRSHRPRAPLTTPVRIPERVAALFEDTRSLPNATETAGPGVVGGTENPDTVGFVDRFLRDVPQPPPPAPVVREQPKAEVVRVKVGGVVQPPRVIRQPKPGYPALARQARISGTVKLLGVIGTDGTVQQLRVLSGHPLLVPAALEAVRLWLYTPTLLNGVPVEVEAPIDVNFTLSQ